jgi:hypothetical protein
VIQARALVRKSRAIDADRSILWRLTEQLFQELAQGAVLFGRNEIQHRGLRFELLEQRRETLMLDATGKRPAAHYPGVDVQLVTLDASLQHGDFA